MTNRSDVLNSDLRLTELDGLRAISILLVLSAHMLPLGPKSLRLNDYAGAMGMSLFFALSGFLITSTLLHRPQVTEFLVRRFARILPLYFLYIFLVFLFWDHGIERLLQSALFTINYQTQFLGSYTGHLWSLCVEMHFYIIIAIAVGALGPRAIWLIWPACLAVTLMRVGAGEYISIRTHHRVDEILAGACVASLYPYFKGWRSNSGAAKLAIFAAAALWIAASSPFTGALQYFRPYGSAAVLASTIWTAPILVRRVLSSSPARYIAEISYALYIIHPATVAGWMNDGSLTTRYFLKRPVSLILTFILAHLSTFHWEAIWRKWAKSYLDLRRQRDMRV